ncbi:MAG: lysylphosphatidylglycerol synthase transmembrane domain-containing protein [bacterium]
MKRTASTLLRIVISFGLLGLLGYLFRNQLGQCLLTLQQAETKFLLFAFLTYILFIWISAWRWQILLNAQGLIYPARFLAQVFTLGLFFCKLLPTSIGGDVMRIAYTTKPGKGAEAFSATLLDRLIGFESLTFLAIVMALFLTLNRTGALSLGKGGLTGFGVFLLLLAILVVLLLINVILFNDRCHNFARNIFTRLPFRLNRLTTPLDRAYETVKRYRHHPRALTLSFLSGIGVQAALSLAWFFCARSVQAAVPIGYYFVFIPLLNIVVNIPTIGGLGVREAVFIAFFTPGWLPGKMNPNQALATALIFLGLDLVFALIGGIIFAFTPRRTRTETVKKEVS